jgi:NCAIR mutase (PurE)-related protein
VTPAKLRKLLGEVRAGRLGVAEAERRLQWAPLEDLEFATVDHHRGLRHGFPEVIYGEGKTPDQIVAIAQSIASKGDGLLATRLASPATDALAAALPEIEINSVARTAFLPPVEATAPAQGPVLVVAAGTSDLPVAEEAAVTAAAYGNAVLRLSDVGVAGLHRLLASSDLLLGAAVIIAVAGMEGALPSVVGGLVRCPVIAVPTSVGYGVSAGGYAALAGMLASCASGITVVNIDNGFGAAVAASRITMLASLPRERNS